MKEIASQQFIKSKLFYLFLNEALSIIIIIINITTTTTTSTTDNTEIVLKSL